MTNHYDRRVDIETNVALTDDKHEIINRYPNNAIAQESIGNKKKR